MTDKEHNEGAETATAVAENEEEEFKFAEDPKFEIDYKGECLYEVKVELAPANEKQQAKEMFDELASEAQLPGFRKGKAPRKLLEKKFGKSVRGEVTAKLVTESFQKLVKDEELKPLSRPEVEGLDDGDKRKEGEAIAFTLKFEVAPRCELGKYRGIQVERPVLTADATSVDETLKRMREHSATYEPMKQGKAKKGDQVIIDFKGMIDGEEFEGGSAENYPYILGSKRFFSEFEDALAGAKGGDEADTVVHFPEDYSNAALAGKSADFAIKVNEVKRKKVPKFDDEFAKHAGFDDAAAMREKVGGDLRDGAVERGKRVAEANAVEQIVAASTFELPKSLLESSAAEYYNQELRRLMALRVPASVLEEREEELRKQAMENAEKNIKAFVVVNEIGVAEDIEITEEDFEKEAEAIQARTGMEMDAISRFLQQQQQQDDYESRIYRKKAMAVIMDNATVTEKEVTSEELEKQDEQAIS